MEPHTALAEQTPAEIDTQLFPILEKIAKAEYYQGQNAKSIERHGEDSPIVRATVESRERIAAELEGLNAEAQPLEDEYNRRRWTRYILVQGNRGHLHRYGCSTLTPGRTMVGLVYESSGLTAEEIAAKHSYTACTHCFPDAPVEAKKTPAEEGFCAHSGEYVPDEKLPDNWQSRYISPSVRCECGHFGAITKGGKFRKHKAAS